MVARMTDLPIHSCTERECPYFGQPTNGGCLCHKTTEQMLVEQRDALLAALNERDLFINPDALDQAANEIDCGALTDGCDYCWHEWDTNAGGCWKSERGDYCPNDVAETLRALAKVARRSQAK